MQKGLDETRGIMAPAPFDTDRLHVRPFIDADVDWLIALDGDIEVMRYITGKVTPPDEVRRIHPKVIAAYDTYAEQGRPEMGTVAVERRDTGEPIGWITFKPLRDVEHVEIGWRFLRSSWGQGFATEAARARLASAFETGEVDQVVAIIDPPNVRSARVAQKLGMTCIGNARYLDWDVDVWVTRADSAEVTALAGLALRPPRGPLTGDGSLVP